MPLNDLAIKRAKPGPKIIKLSDGGGLQLWITPDGAKRWRMAYRFGGAQKVLAIGVYSAVGLKEAREARDAAKRLLWDGHDPSFRKKADMAARAAATGNTFENLSKELIDKKRREGKAGATLEKLEWLLTFVLPTIGLRPIDTIKAPEILEMLRTLESRGRLETARRLRSTIGEVFRYAIATGRAEGDPTGALRGAIATPKVTPRAAIVAPVAFGGLLRAIDGYQGAPETCAALKLLALTFVRPGELRAAEWSEFDLEAAAWEIPAGRMKMRRAHRVPLSARAVAILQELHKLTGHGRLLLPSLRSVDRPISENTLNAALRRMGFAKDEMSGHGFRAAASSMLNESTLWHADAIERQLAHADADTIRSAYARAEFWDERVRMMAWWADRCDELRRGGEVVAFTKPSGAA
jgi:integrase